MKITAKDILKPALILFVICLVVTALLAGTNLLTKDKIAEQSALEAEQSRKVVLSDADSFEEADGYYIGKANNETVGYVFQTEAKGYGGAVKVMTGISADGQITGVVILEHSETPGLGANAEKTSFTDQFKQTAPEKGITLVKNKAPSDGEIEAMTGASITSRAVTNAVNEAITKYNTFEEADGYYIGKANNETVGYVFQTEAKGYGGAVKVMTGISADGQITGVVILEHSETPGLGANAEKTSFTDQFKQTAPEKGITLVKNKAPSDGEIEAMTGASITSRAVTNAVNEAITKYNTVKEGA